MLNLKKDWKESKSILGKLRQEAKKINPQKLLITDIAFGLIMISFFILAGITLNGIKNANNFNLVEKLFIVSSAIFSAAFLSLTYLLVIKGISKNKTLKKL